MGETYTFEEIYTSFMMYSIMNGNKIPEDIDVKSALAEAKKMLNTDYNNPTMSLPSCVSRYMYEEWGK